MQISIHLFGPTEVTIGDRVIRGPDFPSRKVKQLCEVLAAAGGKPVSKDRIIDLLWAGRLPQHPGATVDHTVSQLRSLLRVDDDVQPILTERGRYRFDLTVVEIDLMTFDAAVDGAVREADPAGYLGLLDAVDLVRGQVLEDEPYAEWVEPVRDRYDRRVERVLLEVARRALAHDEPGTALPAAVRARTSSPVLLEEAYILNVSALLRLGRRQEARLLVTELEHRVTSEDGELSPEASLLRAMVRGAGTGSAGTAAVATTARPTEPLAALPFVGRRVELGAIDDAIERVLGLGTSELHVVSGPAGIGRSRLLSEVAARRPGRLVHTAGCLSTDREHPLFVATRLLRALANRAGVHPKPTPEDVAGSVFQHLADALDRLGPTVLLIDDFQWADPASVAVIAGLARPGIVESLLVVAAERTPDDESVLPEQGIDRRHDLGPLARADVETLPLERAWPETGGHPGLLVACVDAAGNDGRLDHRAIRDVLERVDDAGPMARPVLATAASLAPAFTTNELAFALGLTRSTTGELLERPVDLHVLRPVAAVVDCFEFSAGIVRRVLRTIDRGEHRRPLADALRLFDGQPI